MPPRLVCRPPPGDQLESPARFLYVKLFAFAVDVPPAVPLSHAAIQSLPMQTLKDALTAAALTFLAWLTAVCFLSL